MRWRAALPFAAFAAPSCSGEVILHAGHEGSCANSDGACGAHFESGSSSSSRRALHILEGPFVTEGVPPEGQDARLALREALNASTGQWSGHRVWPAAFALLDHLHRTRGESLRGLQVLELGCGLPFLAAALAALGAEVCATDHPDALQHVEAALASDVAGGAKVQGLDPTARARLRVRPLAWQGAEATNITELCGFTQPVDLLVGADLVYHAFPLEPLRETVVSVLRTHGAVAVLALQARRFPMVAALKEPQRVANFLRGFAAEGVDWDVSADKVGKPGDPESEGLVLASITPPGVRPLARKVRAHSGRATRPLRYRREDIAGVVDV